MCMVSNIGDGWRETFPKKWPSFPQWPQVPEVYPSPDVPFPYKIPAEITRKEFDALKKEIEELKKLLEAAKKFDESTGQPHCEMDEKVAMIKAVAKAVGVDLGDVFEGKK